MALAREFFLPCEGMTIIYVGKLGAFLACYLTGAVAIYLIDNSLLPVKLKGLVFPPALHYAGSLPPQSAQRSPWEWISGVLVHVETASLALLQYSNTPLLQKSSQLYPRLLALKRPVGQVEIRMAEIGVLWSPGSTRGPTDRISTTVYCVPCKRVQCFSSAWLWSWGQRRPEPG